MSDYELLSLFYQIVDTSTSSFANFMTIVFAMLVAGYLVAHQLDRIATTLVILIFTVACAGISNEMRGLAANMALVAHEIAAQSQQPGSSLGWHPAANGQSFDFIQYILVILASLIYMGTLWFFLRSRAAGGTGFRKPQDTQQESESREPNADGQ